MYNHEELLRYLQSTIFKSKSLRWIWFLSQIIYDKSYMFLNALNIKLEGIKHIKQCRMLQKFRVIARFDIQNTSIQTSTGSETASQNASASSAPQRADPKKQLFLKISYSLPSQKLLWGSHHPRASTNSSGYAKSIRCQFISRSSIYNCQRSVKISMSSSPHDPFAAAHSKTWTTVLENCLFAEGHQSHPFCDQRSHKVTECTKRTSLTLTSWAHGLPQKDTKGHLYFTYEKWKD